MRIELLFPRDWSEDLCRKSCDTAERVIRYAFGGDFRAASIVDGRKSYRPSKDRAVFHCVITLNPRPERYSEVKYLNACSRFYAALSFCLQRCSKNQGVPVLVSSDGSPITFFRNRGRLTPEVKQSLAA